MAPIKPMLGEIELQLVQKIDTEQDQTLAQHSVPALEGDFLQRLGRRASRITLNGVMTGPESGDSLKTLREKFRAAEPVSFVADIATATKVDSVMIEELAVRELAGKPQRFAYSITLRELLPAPPPETEDPPTPDPIDPPPPPDVLTGTLEVEVIAEGDPDFDFGRVVITIERPNDDGTTFTRTLTSRSNNIWTEPNLAPGRYTVRAATLDPQPLTDTGTGQVQGGQTTRVTLTIRVSSPVATTFLISFRFDKAFVEPCEREVLRQVVAFSNANPTQKLLIVGHTDEVDTPAYNQSLSERRARSVYAFLTFGRDPTASFNEWNALRLARPRSVRRGVRDNWGLRQAQHMLQDLGFYPGDVDGKDGPLTQEAVRAFRCQKGLPPGTNIDDDVWEALIRDYMAQDSFSIPAERFFSNCSGEIVKWLGCGEEDPVKRTGSPFRPSRRVEMLFVRANSFPCTVPQPDTFNEPETGQVNANGWCVGPGAANAHGCFVTPYLQRNTNTAQACSTSPTGPWCRQPAEPGTITVQGSIMFENGTPARSQPFSIIAPNGEFIPGELGNGEPQIGQTDNNGNFTFSDKRKGFYSLSVLPRQGQPPQPPFLVRLNTQTDAEIKGNVVCKALRSSTERLDVVIIDAPAIREIKLPAAMHLMTALHPLTRATRTCPSTLGPPAPQATTHTAAEVTGFMEAANRIWRQARVRLRLAAADIVREAYAFRTECEVDSNEFTIILERCAYPNTVNFFFFGDLSGNSEAGMFVLAPVTGPRVTVDGCAVSDRFQFTVFSPPVDVALDTAQSEQVVAHEFGHFLSLAAVNHVPNTPANSNRLMLAGTQDGSNRTLDQTEVAQARASNNAGLDCLPLELRVTGAQRIGGARSHEHLVFQDATGGGTVTIDADINARLLDPTVGSLDLQGGTPGANPLQRLVSTAANVETEVVGTYTPARGGNPVITYVSIRVITFTMDVDGARRSAPGSNTFITSPHPTDLVIVKAVIAPAPFCVPFDMVTWAGGNELPDPLRRSVSRVSGGPPVQVSATLLGRTETVTIVILAVTIADVRLIGKGQNTDVQITLNPSPLPAGSSLTLELNITAGTGAAQFVSTGNTRLTLTQTSTVAVRGITESSAVDNLRLLAHLTGETNVIAQRDLTVVAVTIGSVLGVKTGQTLDIPITIAPSPLPPGTSLTLELSTTTGTGAAVFNSNNGTTLNVTQTGNVTVRGVTASSVADNIRLTARITGQTPILAQELFSVLNPINIFLQFEVWNLNTRRFETLPAGVAVDLMDHNAVLSDTLIKTERTDASGRVVYSLPNFRPSDEDNPDLYFRVRPNGIAHAGHRMPNEWKTRGWRATNGSPGQFDDFSGTQLGTQAAPLVYRIGLDFHLQLTYLDLSKTPPVNNVVAPKNSFVSFFRFDVREDNRVRTFDTDANGEVHAVIFDVEGGDSVFLTVDFKIEDRTINMRRAKVDIDAWETAFDDNDQTSIGTQAAPLHLNANSDQRNEALFFLKCLRELSTFLFHMTGGAWTGFEDLTYFRTARFGTSYSWPVGSVNLNPRDHWNRGVIIHETTHQTMWKELNFSSADIAFEALFGQLQLTHFESLLSNTEHALIEGWPEFFQAIFASTITPPYNVATVFTNSSGAGARPLGPPPQNNRGESVEGAFANGLWAIFENHVVTLPVFTAAGAFDAHVAESVTGDITTIPTNAWITDPAVRARFLAIIWNPFRNTRLVSNKTTTEMIRRMRIQNPVEWPALQAELQNFNMGF
jgi:outer membrane protein OmpA-like peptidoglycan-associated protein